jgi:hypothetical protein
MADSDKTPPTTAVDQAPAKSAGKGLHTATEREVKVDDYPERPYSKAMTSEQRDALKEAGLL